MTEIDFRNKFRIVSAKDFIPEVFAYHPLWSEFYDFDELDDIERWGLNRQTTFEELKSKTIEQQHPFYTLPLSEFPPLRMRYFCLANILTKSGRLLQGSIMNDGELIIEVFLDSNLGIILSRHPFFENETRNSLMSLARSLQITPEELSTISYKTVLTDHNGNHTEGKVEFQV
jgi:hypothetical protein